jgi:uncharacterized membrane protein
MHLNPIVRRSLVIILTILFSNAASVTPAASAQQPVARAIMFWMDGCPHCHEVLENVLPPLERQYGDRLEIRLIEVSTREDMEYLYKVATAYGFSTDAVGVPFLIMGDEALVGSDQVAQLLPSLIDRYLAAGGVDFPALPGVEAGQVPGVPFVVEDPALPAQIAAADLPASAGNLSVPLWRGFGLAIAILAGMVGALIYTVVALVRGIRSYVLPEIARWQELAFLLLVLVGLGVAGYLAYVETQSVSAVCGPIGDCNTVQSSPFARLFGVLPIGVLGVIGYLLMIGAWLWKRFGMGGFAEQMPLALFGMTLFGVLFSLYLTYLEPFVIGAVCIWCLTSAVLMTLLMLLTISPVMRVLNGDELQK